MDKEEESYIRKIYFVKECMEKFININIENNIKLYFITLNSITTDEKEFRKLWKYFQQSFFRKFKGEALGVMERTAQGFLHIHLAVTFEEKQMLTKLKKVGTKLWTKQNLKHGYKLHKDSCFHAKSFKVEKKDRFLRYISKLVHHSGKPSYLAKPTGLGSSFQLSVGKLEGKYWDPKDKPYLRKGNSIKKLKKELIEFCNEKTKNLWCDRLINPQYTLGLT
jgi:hypothetical protein